MNYWANHKKLLGVALFATSFLLLSALWSASASLRGYLVAEFDIARGHYELLGYGLPVEWLPDYVRLLRERYGVRYRAVTGCIVSGSLISYVDAYNRVSTAAANRKFGRDVFKECADEARTTWARRTGAIMKN